MDEVYRQRPPIRSFASVPKAAHPKASVEAFDSLLLVDPMDGLSGSLVFCLHPCFEGLEGLLDW